jgi:hypothetical protein
MILQPSKSFPSFLLQGALCVFILAGNVCKGQVSEIKVFNKTGFDLDSVVVFKKFFAHLPKDSVVAVAPFQSFYSSSGIPLDVPKGIIRLAKQVPALKGCGTKAKKITQGKHLFDLTVYETGLGLCLRYVPHAENKK